MVNADGVPTPAGGARVASAQILGGEATILADRRLLEVLCSPAEAL